MAGVPGLQSNAVCVAYNYVTPRPSSTLPPPTTTRRAGLRLGLAALSLFPLFPPHSLSKPEFAARPDSDFVELPNSGGVRVLDLRIPDAEAGAERERERETPSTGDKVSIHYYGRLAAKQGWRFDSTYDHRDDNGEPTPFEFVLGSGKVIAGIESAVRSMKVGGIRRVIIPPSQGYQDTSQEPIPPNFFDRQRLFTTIFNPTRLANGGGSTLGTLIFDIEVVSIRH